MFHPVFSEFALA